MTEETSTQDTATQDARTSKRNLALGTTAGVATLFLMLRLFAVAEWDWETAAGIAETIDFSDALPIVLGTLFAEPVLTGVLLAVLVPFSLVNLAWPPTPDRRWRISHLLFPLSVLVAATTWFITFPDPWFLATAVVTAAVLVTLRLVWRHGAGHRVVLQFFHRIGTVTVGAILVLAVAVQTPWMSHERISTVDGPVTGYVLEVESGFVKILTDDREVVIFTTDEVTARRLLD